MLSVYIMDFTRESNKGGNLFLGILRLTLNERSGRINEPKNKIRV